LAVQFTSIKEAGFNRKATRGASRVVAFFFEILFLSERLYCGKLMILTCRKYFHPTVLCFGRERPTSSTRFLKGMP